MIKLYHYRPLGQNLISWDLLCSHETCLKLLTEFGVKPLEGDFLTHAIVWGNQRRNDECKLQQVKEVCLLGKPCDLEKQVPTFRVALEKWQKLQINVVSSVCENDGLASVLTTLHWWTQSTICPVKWGRGHMLFAALKEGHTHYFQMLGHFFCPMQVAGFHSCDASVS